MTARILHVFPSFAMGGAQMRMAALANHFDARFAHVIVPLDNDDACRARLDPGLDVTILPAPDARGGLLARLRGIAAALRTIDPALLITSNWGTIEWAIANRLFRRVRHIHTEDGFGRDERDHQIPRRVLMRRLVLRGSDVVVPSLTLQHVARSIWRLRDSRLHYIPNGIDLARFAPATTVAAVRPRIGCVAALRPEKNLSRLLGAGAIAARSHEFELVIIGDGPERALLAAEAASLGITARLDGPSANPAPLYRSFDIFALSSDTEQMPLSVMEAMATGLPIVATDVGDIAAMVAPQNRPYLTARTDAALGDALSRMLDLPDRGQSIGAQNRRRAEQTLDFTTMAARWAGLLG